MNRDDAKAAPVSDAWDVRATAARLLVQDPDDDWRRLVDVLLLDENLAVAQAAGSALLASPDPLDVAQFTGAYLAADDQRGDHFNDVLRVAVDENPDLVETLRTLSGSNDPGARTALAWLAGT